MDNVGSFLSWVAYSGGSLLIASWALDRIPKFLALPSDVKRITNLIVSIILALGFYAILTYVPAVVIAAIDPWFKVVVGIIALYTGQQVVHKLTKPE